MQKKFDTVGIDLVAMCSNDLLCNFGEPLFFPFDYYATAKLNVEEATQVVKESLRVVLEVSVL